MLTMAIPDVKISKVVNVMYSPDGINIYGSKGGSLRG